jgi:hypothetical protein
MQAMECRRLARQSTAKAEAELLLDMAKSWVRLANQTQRYFVLKKARSSENRKVARFDDHQPKKAAAARALSRYA